LSKTRVIVILGLLISLDIILTRFLSIQTPILRIGFGFIPIALSGMLFGPIIGGVAAAVGDILGMLIFPHAPYFPGFTVSAFAGGCIYGLFLHKQSPSLIRTTIAVSLIVAVVDLGLNTALLSFLTGKAAMVLIPARLAKSLVMLPVQIFLIYSVCRYFTGGKFLKYSRTEH
jgi:ECF transporter S component (folate family)